MTAKLPVQIGYCTNIHAGIDLDSVLANLNTYSVPIKNRVSSENELGVGLWLAASVVSQLDSTQQDRLNSFLRENELVPFTFNAFPYSNFHQPVVKHDVYVPTWAQPERFHYTLEVARLASRLLPESERITISTLPLSWPCQTQAETDHLLTESADQLRKMATELHRIQEESGQHIQVCLEPEPGCMLQTSKCVTSFFEHHLLPGQSSENIERILRHIGVCHDVCHSAVMFEGQGEALNNYKASGINIGKVQISSAIATKLIANELDSILIELSEFAEPRYLHQSVIKQDDESYIFTEDLPIALGKLREYETHGSEKPIELRSHFHVPVFLESINRLQTTRQAILECLDVLKNMFANQQELPHFEVETYAWSVSPSSIRNQTLEDCVVKELQWFHGELERVGFN